MNQLVALFNEGRYAELESRTRVLIQQYPDSGFAWKVFGTSLLVQGKDALAALQKTTELLPEDTEARNNLGNALRDLVRLDEAVASYRRALEIKPDFAEAHSNLGNALKDLGHLGDAVASYRRALEFNPDLADTHHNLGVVLQTLGQLDKAVASYRRTLAIKPGYAEAHSNLGTVLQALGQLDDAVGSYRRALEIKPDYAEAHYNLGNALQALGHLDGAVASFRRALEIEPKYIEAHNDLGAALRVLGHLDEAAASCRRALQINRNFAEAHSNLGVALTALGQLDDAVASYRDALQIKPDFAEAHNNLGTALKELGQLDDAVASYRRALEIKPVFADAHYNLGTALQALGRLGDASASYRRALEIDPEFADAHSNLGVTLLALGQLDEAVASYRRALEIKPDYAEAHSNLGAALRTLGQLDEAATSCRRALELKPDYAEAHSNLGATLHALGQLNDAVASCRRALELKPDYADVHHNLGAALQAIGQLDDAVACYHRALEIKPDFANSHHNLSVALQTLGQLDDAMASSRRALEIKPDFAEAHTNLIFTLDLSTGVSIATLQQERSRWDSIHAAPLAAMHHPHANRLDPERRLRIGYVSADFRMHSAASVFGAMLHRFDPSCFEVFAYSNGMTEDWRTRLLQQDVTCWRKIVGRTDEAVAELIRQDEIDILVDLSGHSAGNRLMVFARKPAPIQITAWGYIGGTGLKAMDVFFADPVVVPPEEKHFYAEEVRYLPNVVGHYLSREFPAVNPLPALSTNRITFGSFNRLTKISDEAYQVWVRILLAIPDSRMVFKTHELDDAGVKARVARHFTQAGIVPERIVLLGKTSWDEHMANFNQIDIALDPFPHGGGVTTLEGLMMGVPVVTLRWPTVPGRLSASILTTLGLSDWIAETPEQYVEIAIRKAQALPALADLRKRLRGIFTSSIIGDSQAYVKAVEQEYRKLWREWCARQVAVK